MHEQETELETDHPETRHRNRLHPRPLGVDGGACRRRDPRFNDFLADQQQVEGLGRLTLVLFDDVLEMPFDNIPSARSSPSTPAPTRPAAAPPSSTRSG